MIIQSDLTTDLELDEAAEVSKTYKLTDDKIQGYVDELEALKQYIYKVICTEKYKCPIYSLDYGIELESLIGKDKTYVQIELQRRITECLIQDGRINNVNNFVFFVSGDELFCTFDVVSVYGTIAITKGVTV